MIHRANVIPLRLIPLLVAAAMMSCAKADLPPVHPAKPVIPERKFFAEAYEAKGDGISTNTASLQKAIDAASLAGGGTVILTKGIYLCGPIRMASHVNLCVKEGTVLRMLPMDQYPGGTDNPENFVSARGVSDIAISGTGTIDGQGAPWWPLAKMKTDKKSKTRNRPRMIAISECDRILIEGIHLENSPMFHIATKKSSNFTLQGVSILAPASTNPVTPSHNTDACDVSGTNILIKDCNISVGDDNFTCGGDTADVLITNCTYGSGHGVSIGSYTRGAVSNITVSDCTFRDTDNGIRIKTDRDRGGFVHDITYTNLRMTNVRCPILVYEAYKSTNRIYRDLNNLTPETAAGYPPQAVEQLTPVFSNLVFKNITATVQPGRRAGLIWGLPEMPISNVTLENVEITADKPFGIYFVKNARILNSRIRTPEGVNQIVQTNSTITMTPSEQ